MFEPLERLFRHDRVKMSYALGVLRQVLVEDAGDLSRFRDASDWNSVCRVAHKIKSGCLQAGRNDVAGVLLLLEEAAQVGITEDNSVRDRFDAATKAIEELKEDIDAYLAENGE